MSSESHDCGVVGATAIYLLAVLIANLTATLFIPFPIFGQVAVGTLLFGLTFTQRDRLHVLGRARVYGIIATAGATTAILLISYKYGWSAPLLDLLHDQNWRWLADGMATLASGGVRVLAASVLALVLAEAVDTEVFHRAKSRWWLLRALQSNAVSIPVDSLIFNAVAFAGVFDWSTWWAIVFGEVVVKFVVGAGYALFLAPSRASASKAA